MNIEKLHLKYLLRSHTIIGLFCLFLFYISSFFGAITLFLPYINAWETPSKHFKSTSNYHFNIDEHLDKLLTTNQFLTENIEITFPSFKDNRIQISALNQNSLYLNPNTNEVLTTKFEQKTVSDFFNILHFGANIPYIGQPLMGMASIGILFLIISGLLLFIHNNKKEKQILVKNYKKRWIQWHKYLGLTLLPFIFIFVITGAFLGFMLFSSTPFALSASNFEETNLRKLVAPIIFKQKQNLPQNSTIVPMQKLSFLIQTAQENYPELKIQKATIYNYNKENSQVVFSGYLQDNKAISGRTNRMSITLKSTTAEVLEKTTLENTHSIKKALSAFYYLHFIPDETFGLRVVFFVLSLSMMICLVFGYLIWAEKKLKHINEIHYFNFLNRLSIALMIGIIPSTCFVLFLHWLLPFDTFDRDIWIKGCFYSLWAFTFFYAIYESIVLKSIKLFFITSAVLLICTVLLHGLKTNLYFWESFQQKILDIFYVDIALLLFAAVFLLLGLNLHKIPSIQRFNKEEIYHYDS